MARVKHKVVGSGVFFSPALNADAPYELLDVVEGRTVTAKAVRCVQSQQVFDISRAQRQPMVSPDSVRNDLTRITEALQARHMG